MHYFGRSLAVDFPNCVQIDFTFRYLSYLASNTGEPIDSMSTLHRGFIVLHSQRASQFHMLGWHCVSRLGAKVSNVHSTPRLLMNQKIDYKKRPFKLDSNIIVSCLNYLMLSWLILSHYDRFLAVFFGIYGRYRRFLVCFVAVQSCPLPSFCLGSLHKRGF